MNNHTCVEQGIRDYVVATSVLTALSRMAQTLPVRTKPALVVATSRFSRIWWVDLEALSLHAVP